MKPKSIGFPSAMMKIVATLDENQRGISLVNTCKFQL
ncbi:hypothetical protein AGR1B_pTi0213 [Agrobacterium fabacearum S56]|nr:hypothetical protein AGR1B_pTi0213 [Agrobacterium fabacearum S56]